MPDTFFVFQVVITCGIKEAVVKLAATKPRISKSFNALPFRKFLMEGLYMLKSCCKKNKLTQIMQQNNVPEKYIYRDSLRITSNYSKTKGRKVCFDVLIRNISRWHHYPHYCRRMQSRHHH